MAQSTALKPRPAILPYTSAKGASPRSGAPPAGRLEEDHPRGPGLEGANQPAVRVVVVAQVGVELGDDLGLDVALRGAGLEPGQDGAGISHPVRARGTRRIGCARPGRRGRPRVVRAAAARPTAVRRRGARGRGRARRGRVPSPSKSSGSQALNGQLGMSSHFLKVRDVLHRHAGERIEQRRALRDDERRIHLAQRAEQVTEVVVRERGVGIERDGALERLLRRGEIPVVPEPHAAERRVGVGERRVQPQCVQCGGLGPGDTPRAAGDSRPPATSRRPRARSTPGRRWSPQRSPARTDRWLDESRPR